MNMLVTSLNRLPGLGSLAMAARRFTRSLELLGTVSLLSAGCAKPTTKAAPPAPSAAGTDSLAGFLQNQSAPATQGVYEKILLELEECRVIGTNIDPQCPGLQNYYRARGRKAAPKSWSQLDFEAGKKFIEHESPAIRVQSAKLLGGSAASNPEACKVLVSAAREEKDPHVLPAMLHSAAPLVRRDAGARELMLPMSDHPWPAVRIQALESLLAPWSSEIPGAFEKVLDKVKNDPHPGVRGQLCSRLYASGDERALPVFEQYLLAEGTPKEIFVGCWKGVVSSWVGMPRPSRPSQRGYALTLKLLNRQPRSQDFPPEDEIMPLRLANVELSAKDQAGAQWVEQVKEWYKKDRLIQALDGLAKDRKASWKARTSAIRVMVELGAKRETIEALARGYGSAEAATPDGRVKDVIAELLKQPAGSGASSSTG
jgi:hypothetical protein